MAQSFPDWECICVDDGSRDGSGDVAERFARHEPRIRVLRRANGGTSAARNAAMAEARGNYLAFLDEDDIYHPRYLEILHSAAERNRADVVGIDFLPFGEDSRPDFSPPPVGDEGMSLSDEIALRDHVADWYDGVPWEVWRHLYRRDRVMGLTFPVGVRVEQDLRWHYSLLPRFKRYVRLRWAGYGWRRNSAGGVLNPSPESLISEAQTFKDMAVTLPRDLGLSEEQISRLRGGIARWCKAALCSPLRRGVRFTHAESIAFRAAVRALCSAGVDVREALGTRKRLLWNLFMLTGLEGFTRL